MKENAAKAAQCSKLPSTLPFDSAPKGPIRAPVLPPELIASVYTCIYAPRDSSAAEPASVEYPACLTLVVGTFDRFLADEEINDLFVSGPEGMYVILAETGFRSERAWEVQEGRARCVVDLAIPYRDGVGAIDVTDRAVAPSAVTALRTISTSGRTRALGEDRNILWSESASDGSLTGFK